MYGYKLKSEPNQGWGDDTALNDIALHCREANSTNVTKSVSGSDPGPWGSFSSDKYCSGLDNPVVGFVVQHEMDKIFWDDSAVNNIKLLCRNNEVISAYVNTHWGYWMKARRCTAGFAVMGISTQVEKYQGDGDDSALNGIKLFCMPYLPKGILRPFVFDWLN